MLVEIKLCSFSALFTLAWITGDPLLTLVYLFISGPSVAMIDRPLLSSRGNWFSPSFLTDLSQSTSVIHNRQQDNNKTPLNTDILHMIHVHPDIFRQDLRHNIDDSHTLEIHAHSDINRQCKPQHWRHYMPSRRIQCRVTMLSSMLQLKGKTKPYPKFSWSSRSSSTWMCLHWFVCLCDCEGDHARTSRRRHSSLYWTCGFS